ncbi:benzoate/H(+) symporter BenE family transporter [Salinactinospora qingdaonensis]|uniref:Benzoate/H(+) symporter BenE family transporter n=1 Tax=Salinactinospora qingdaonensis TaxID=702744 RepID=A0ABP7GEP7_9ACTN
MASLKSVLPDIPLSTVTAGFVTVLVGITSSAAIVFQAAQAAGATQGQLSSWLLALGVGMGVTSIGLSLRYRAPVVTAWSTPGAALLATSLNGTPMAEVIGAFLFSALLIVVCGVTGWFGRLMGYVPMPIVSALLAGVLVEFGMGAFTSLGEQPVLVLGMLVAYLVCKRLLARYAIVVALTSGVVIAIGQGLLDFAALRLEPAAPVFTMPELSWTVAVSVGIPLFVVTMASQNIPGVAVLRGSGYDTPVSPLITVTGATNLALAPFGCFGLNLAAITGAICSGPESHEDPARRYLASVWAGVFYLLVGVFGGTIGALLTAVPEALVLTIAGLGLFSTIANSMATALREERTREAAIITFLITASGVTLLGIGSAFWGLAGGVAAWTVMTVNRRSRQEVAHAE